MRVAVIGAGKMGLPVACQFAHQGATVIACDINPLLVEAINSGRCPIDEPGVPELLEGGVRSGRLKATTDTTAAVAASEVIVVIVPALLTDGRRADTSILEAASRKIAEGLQRGAMVCYETTLPVGATRNVLRPILEESGLKAGEDFSLVFSPERVKSQLVLKHLTQTPKVVGGIDAASAERGFAFYQQYLGAPAINVGSLEAAELVKLAGMIYRDVNIALSNEIARYAEQTGVDLGPVIAATNTDGDTFMLIPGIGVGGHCTPVYPYFLTHDADRLGVPVTIAERARRVNDTQPGHMVGQLERRLGSLRGRRVLILGLGFRPQVKEHYCSTTFLLRDELERRGAEALVHDPLYTEDEIRAAGFNPGSLDAGSAPDAVILCTAHQVYRDLDVQVLARRGVRALVDGRNIWSAEIVAGTGMHYLSVGRPAVPEMETPAPSVPFARPSMGSEEADAAAEAIRSGWVTQGPRVADFEREFAEYVGAPHACAVSSATTGLHLALHALGVGPGDEVITVSHSFIATANAIRHCGAQPVFVDIEPQTYNIDPRLLEAAITPRTRAIMPVHQIGLPCDMTALLEIAERRGLPVVEDAACAIGSEIRIGETWERIGRPHGVVACFSFHPRKILTTGDGGMITTRDPELDQRFRMLRQHSMSLSDVQRSGMKHVVFEDYPFLGFNYRMTDIQAAVGRVQLRRMAGMLKRRIELGEAYTQAIREISGLAAPHVPAYARPNYQSYAVRVTPEYPLSRDALMQYLLDNGVNTRRGIMNAHQEGAYAYMGPQHLPHSEAARDSVVLLPFYGGMRDAEVVRVVELLRAPALSGSGRGSALLPREIAGQGSERDLVMAAAGSRR